MVKILHIDLKPRGAKEAKFRFFGDNPNDYQERPLSLDELSRLKEKAETDYHTKLPVPYAQTGRAWVHPRSADSTDRLM